MKTKETLEVAGVFATKEEGGIVALDFDNVPLPTIIEEILRIIHKRKLGDCLIVQSSEKNYHADFLWDEFSYDEIVKITKEVKYIDPEFVDFRTKKDYNRMRVTNLLALIVRIHSPYHKPNPRGDLRFNQIKYAIRQKWRLKNGSSKTRNRKKNF